MVDSVYYRNHLAEEVDVVTVEVFLEGVFKRDPSERTMRMLDLKTPKPIWHVTAVLRSSEHDKQVFHDAGYSSTDEDDAVYAVTARLLRAVGLQTKCFRLVPQEKFHLSEKNRQRLQREFPHVRL